jgi:hypothetical protein
MNVGHGKKHEGSHGARGVHREKVLPPDQKRAGVPLPIRRRGLMGLIRPLCPISPIPQSPQLLPYRARQSARTGTTQPRVNGFKPPDKIEHLGARIRAARRRAEMGPAAKGTVLVNHARAVFAQHRTRAVVAFRHCPSPRSAQRPRGQHRLAPRELRRAPGELELAALGAADARAFDGTMGQIAVNGGNFFERRTAQRFRFVGRKSSH